MNRSSLSNRPGPVNVFAAFFVVVSIPFLQPASANPSGATIRHGDIQIVAGGNTLQILQSTSHGIIDWNSFSIQNGQVTQFVQPGASSATLNRVTGQSLSRIDGSLLANGRVLLLNPNGILVGRNGVVDTAGFTASTLDLSNENFLAGGDLRFQGSSTAGVVNLGSINAVDGDVFLIASSILNEGRITASNGTVGLAAGNDVLIAESGSERVFVRGAGTATEDSGVINRGTVNANVAELKSYGGNIYGMAVKNEGRVAATAVTREGGQIFLRAGGGRVRSSGTLTAKKPNHGGEIVVDSGESGTTEVTGEVDVSSETGNGGVVMILGSTVNLFEGSLILADGETDGGQIFVGGGKRGLNPDFNNATNVTVSEGVRLAANAGEVGDGGEIIVFAENRLNFAGSISATGGSVNGDGGFAELSGKNEVLIPDLSSRVSLSSTNGAAGTLLFDPNDIDIVTGTAVGTPTGFPAGLNEIVGDDIISFLETGTNLVIETNGTDGNGDITVRTGVDIQWSSDANLSFLADRDFLLERGAAIDAFGGGGVSITAGRSARFGFAVSPTPFPGGGITTTTGDISVSANAAGTATGDFIGINLFAQNLSTVDGDISLIGRGGNFANNDGVVIQGNVMASGIGNVTVDGIGGSGSGSGGVTVFGASITATDGDILVRGAGGDTGVQNSGVLNSGPITSVGSGNIEVIGTAGAGAGSYGVDNQAEISSVSGSISILGESNGDDGEAGFAMRSTFSQIGGSDTTGNISISADTASLTVGTIQSSGDLVMTPLASNTEINVGAGATDAGLQLDADELALLSDGFNSITIGSSTLSGVVININEVGFSDPVTFLTPNTGGEIFVNGKITGTGDASITLNGAGPSGEGGEPSTTYLSAGISTEGQAIFINDDVVLKTGSPLLLDTTAGGTTDFLAGADVTILGTVIGDSTTAFPSFEINSGSSGGIDLAGAIGDETLKLNNVTLTGADIEIGQLSADGVVTLNAQNPLSLSAPITAGEGVTIRGNLSGVLPGTENPFGLNIGSSVTSENGPVTLVTGRGDMRIGGVISSPGLVELSTTSSESVRFLVETDLSGLANLAFVGGAGVADTVSFAGSTSPKTEVSAGQFQNIESLVGSSSNEDAFSGAEGFAATFDLTGANAFDYTDTDGNSLDVSGFEKVHGGSEDDTFNILSGGSIQMIAGGGGVDTIDFSSFGQNVFVDIGNSSASQISAFEEVEKFNGATAGLRNEFIATGGDDEIWITGDGQGSLVTARGFVLGENGGPFVETIDFTAFQSVDGGAGSDEFDVDLDGSAGTFFDGTLAGGSGDDTFTIRSGSVGSITGSSSSVSRGGPGSDTIDLSALDVSTKFVNFESRSASGVNAFGQIDAFIGGGGVTSTVQGTNQSDVFTLTEDGVGTVRYPFGEGGENVASFSGFGNVEGQGGDDRFLIELIDPVTTIRSGRPGPGGGFGVIPVFDGTLDGGSGSDTFEFVSGRVVAISGGEGNEGDTLDFSQLNKALVVDLVEFRALVIEPSSGSVSVTLGPLPAIPSVVSETSGAESFDGIDRIIGGSRSNSLYGTMGADTVSIGEGGDGAVTYTDPGGSSLLTLSFEDFNGVDTRGGDDFFTVDVSDDDISATLLGGVGADTFNINFFSTGSAFTSEKDEPTVSFPGAISMIEGGPQEDGEKDVVNFDFFDNDVFVDFENSEASGVEFFSGIELFEGGTGSIDRVIGTSGNDVVTLRDSGTHLFSSLGEGAFEVEFRGFESLFGAEGQNELVGTQGADSFVIETNGGGLASIETQGGSDGFKTAFFIDPNPGTSASIEELNFDEFSIVSGSGGDDEFVVQLPSEEAFDGTLSGGAGEDRFAISRGGSVATILGGSETDTLDFSAFTTPVTVNAGSTSATQVANFSSIESIVGGSAEDTLLGTNGTDQFLINRDNGGFFNSGAFDSFEILQGLGGTDRFTFQTQASVSRFGGGSGTDTFVLDDRNLTGKNTYTVTANSVTRNPTYLFSQIELVQLLLGSGNDTVVTGDNGFVQVFNGGGGNDTIDFGSTPVSGRDPFLIGNSQVFETQFENFILVRDESTNPENINQQGAGPGGNQGPGSFVDQFTNTGGLAEALGNAFGAIAGNAIIAGQASVLQVEGGQIEAPLSLDGFFTQPPRAVVGALEQSLEISAWTELANAIGFGGATILVNNDGPYSILLDGVPPNEILPVLLESLRADAGLELFEALELTIVIPITSDDGPVSILAIPVQIEPAILQLLVDNLNNEAFSELTAALDD